MRFFAFIAAACLLATQASAERENLRKAAECVSHAVHDVWRIALYHMSDLYDLKDPEHEKNVRAMVEELRPVMDNSEEKIRERLSGVDNDCENGTPMENEKCYIRASLEYKTIGLEVARGIAKTCIEAHEKHHKPSSEADKERIKEFFKTMEAYFPHLERVLSECF